MLYTLLCIFCRSNFLKLDVYFATLQKEMINQVPAYGAMNFIGTTDHKQLHSCRKARLVGLLIRSILRGKNAGALQRECSFPAQNRTN